MRDSISLLSIPGKRRPFSSSIEEKGLVSVVIPSYQSKWCVGEAINSVLAQTYTNFEIIVVDDGSTDGTREYIQREYCDKVKVISQENQGLAGARNSGLEVARGEFVQFLDADDILLSEKFATQVNYLLSHPEIDVIIGDIREVDLSSNAPRPKLTKNIPDDILPEIIWSNIVGPVHGPLSKRTVIKQIGGFDEFFHNYCADWEFWLTAAVLNFHFHRVNDLVGIYRRHSSSLREQVIYPNALGDLNVAQRAKQYAELLGQSENWKINDVIRYRHERAAYWATIDVNIKKANEHIWLSVRYVPVNKKVLQVIKGHSIILEAVLKKWIDQHPGFGSFERNIRRNLKR